MREELKPTQVGDVSNYYGGLWIKMENGEPFWCIENYDGMDWTPCPPAVFAALVAEFARRPEATP